MIRFISLELLKGPQLFDEMLQASTRVGVGKPQITADKDGILRRQLQKNI